ncbi:hypothetical protein GCM10009765_42430 [Fodinicola feengrottensis]|uniref:Uncharacterized protein n=1 Tax=Fodinicola feengrottensis TaxID=435914 RepID=A0ABN2HJ43_9ACTN
MVIEVPWPAAVPAPVREDLDRLLTDAVRPADRSIRWTGRFRPYGYQLSASGEITPLPVDTKDVDEALSILRESVSLEAHRAVVVCYDTRLREETIDAVAVELSHQDSPPLLLLRRYRHRGILRAVWYDTPVVHALRPSR